MKTKTQNKTRNSLSPGLAKAYRAYPSVNIDDAVRGLAAFLNHRLLFEALGNTPMVAVVERAWWQDALLLAGEPAGSVDEARRKIEALQAAFDGRPWQSAAEGQRALSAMITVAIEAEQHRWGLETPTRH